MHNGNVNQIGSQQDIMMIFNEIEQEVDSAENRPTLTELYKRAGYLVTLTQEPSWTRRLNPNDAEKIQQAAETEFEKTANLINDRARTIGTSPDYDDVWGEVGTA